VINTERYQALLDTREALEEELLAEPAQARLARIEQQELAALMGIRQASLSKIDRVPDRSSGRGEAWRHC
jgi:hypothetical protein